MPTNEEYAVVSSVATAYRRMNREVGPADFIRLLEDALSTPRELPCMNPECPDAGVCRWTASAGRPKRFCSAICQKRFDRMRLRLVDELNVIQEVLSTPGVRQQEEKRLQSEAAVRRWALERYPSLQPGAGHPLGP